MSYQFYKILHIVSILSIVIALGALLLHTMNGGERKFPNRRWTMLLHGFGMAGALIAGFGLLARLQIFSPWPFWTYLKLAIWFSYGVLPFFILRSKPNQAKALWLLCLILGGSAAYLAVYKPA